MSKEKTNRLIKSKSPYLVQHAFNPVDWYEWGKEAFEKAEKEDKPVFLSIGYSTCHWCHVMAHESFENETIASYMNENFVCIKVDREERPDIDSIYMLVCQMMSRNCGWPLTIVMDCHKKPFFAGTYIPPVSSMGRLGLIDLLMNIMKYWNNNRSELFKTSDAVIDNLQIMSKIQSANDAISLNENIFRHTFEDISEIYDKVDGGFGIDRKFPMPHFHHFLLRYYFVYKDDFALNMVYKTLKKMRYGGIYDQIGGGFHRYSVDSKFLLPHFEKMLYDQAGMILTYTEAYQNSKIDIFSETIKETVEYLKSNLLSGNGAFYSAEDADSSGEEGKFYLWTKSEIVNILGHDAERFIELFNIIDNGNFIPEAGGNNEYQNILHLNKHTVLNNDTKDFIEKCRLKLLDVRNKRVKPLLDNKILTDWNGYTIAALAYAGFVLNNSEYIELAENCTEFLFNNCVIDNGTLLHVSYGSQGEIQGMLDDYAYFIYGLIELYFSTSKIKYLNEAINLTEIAIEEFYDNESGGFYQTPVLSETILIRKKDLSDNAIPSGNSIMLNNLMRLGKILNKQEFINCAETTTNYYKDKIYQNPSSLIAMVNSLFGAFYGSSEMVFAGEKSNINYSDLLNVVQENFLPFNVLLYFDARRDLDIITDWTKNIRVEKEITKIYYCINHTCKMPVSTVESLLKVIADS